MSTIEEHDFIEEYMTWMKGSVVKYTRKDQRCLVAEEEC